MSKHYIKVITPLGEFRSESKELTEEEIEAGINLVKKNLEYFSFNDHKGNPTVFKKQLLENSIIQIIKGS